MFLLIYVLFYYPFSSMTHPTLCSWKPVHSSSKYIFFYHFLFLLASMKQSPGNFSIYKHERKQKHNYSSDPQQGWKTKVSRLTVQLIPDKWIALNVMDNCIHLSGINHMTVQWSYHIN